MKILFVLENYWPHVGGVETVFKNLSERLALSGHEVSIVTHRLKNTEKFERINNVSIHRVNCFYSRYWFTFLSLPKVISLARNADIIHATTYNGAFPARLAAEIFRKPCLITVHEVLGDHWKEFEGMGWLNASLHNLLEKWILNLKFDHYVSVSNSTHRDVLRFIQPEQCGVIYNGVDYKIFDPAKYDKNKARKKLGLQKSFIYMAYGRPGISKGFEYLIRAAPLIKNRIPKAKLILVLSRGKAYENRYRYLRSLIEKLNLAAEIVILDPMPLRDLIEHIVASDCVVVPSLTEGFGYTAAESCALGVPVVASNASSLPEVVSGKYILVKPKNPEAIAAGIEMVYKKKYNKTRLKRFEWSETVKKYLNIYKKLVERSKK